MRSESTVNRKDIEYLLILDHTPVDEQQLLCDSPLRHDVLTTSIASVCAASNAGGESRDKPTQLLTSFAR